MDRCAIACVWNGTSKRTTSSNIRINHSERQQKSGGNLLSRQQWVGFVMRVKVKVKLLKCSGLNYVHHLWFVWCGDILSLYLHIWVRKLDLKSVYSPLTSALQNTDHMRQFRLKKAFCCSMLLSETGQDLYFMPDSSSQQLLLFLCVSITSCLVAHSKWVATVPCSGYATGSGQFMALADLCLTCANVHSPDNQHGWDCRGLDFHMRWYGSCNFMRVRVYTFLYVTAKRKGNHISPSSTRYHPHHAYFNSYLTLLIIFDFLQ